MTKARYVTAFPGRRDSYQVPQALEEHQRLVQFLTDGYNVGPVAGLLRRTGRGRVASRYCNQLPDTKVRPHFRYEIAGRALARLIAPSKASVHSDDWLAEAAARAANATKSSLFLYEFQAERGFAGLSSPSQRRVLFHFHPHAGWEHPLLAADSLAYPEFARITRENVRQGMAPRYARHTMDAWKRADHIIVASSCTKVSLQTVGCPEEMISVVPYGCETLESAEPLASPPRLERPFLLWVGSGSVRKGLHHLCEAWQRSGCATVADLVVIARGVDEGMEAHLARPGIRWLRGVPRAELNWYFSNAWSFVMPSLSEGFGQVYLEALAKGCPVIGTRHSVLADVAVSNSAVTLVPACSVEALAEALKNAVSGNPPTPARRAEISASVSRFTWPRFREGIEEVLRRLD